MLKVVKLHKDAIVPEKAHDGDAGFDLFALEDTIIMPNDTKLVKTGIGVQIPYGYYGDVTGKSGLTLNSNLRVNRGIIDYGYMGDVGVMITNAESYKYNDKLFDNLLERRDENPPQELGEMMIHTLVQQDTLYGLKIRKGQKIAQLILTPCEPKTQVVVMKEFDTQSTRGERGFGSTGLTSGMKSAISESPSLFRWHNPDLFDNIVPIPNAYPETMKLDAKVVTGL